MLRDELLRVGPLPRSTPLSQNHRTPLVSVQAITAPKNKASRLVASVRKGSPRGR